MTKYLLLLLALVALASACATQRNPNVCCTTDADCARLGIAPTGCADGFVCTNFMCVAAQCETATDCTAERPVCEAATATCTGCAGDGDCAAYADAPVCDASGACRACAADSECPSDVCDLDSGRCVDEARVIYAAPSGSVDAACTHAIPCSVQRAVTVAGAAPDGTIVRMLPGKYVDPIAVTGPPVRDIVATGAAMGADSDGLQIGAGASVRVRGLHIVRGSGGARITGMPGISARLELDQARLEERVLIDGDGILRITRSTVTATVQLFGDRATVEADRVVFRIPGGLHSHGVYSQYRVRVTNSLFDRAAISFVSNDDALTRSEYYYAFNTMVGTSVNCILVESNPRLRVFENNIILGPESSSSNVMVGANGDGSPTGCTLSGNIVSPQNPPLDGTNTVAEPDFVDVEAGDFHLRAGSLGIDRAVPSSSTYPMRDLDGVPRPQGQGADVGAYEFRP